MRKRFLFGWRQWISGLLSIAALCGTSAAVWAAPAPNQPTGIHAKAVELLDAQSGKILYSEHAHERLPMASVTKLMTLYLAVQAIQRHQISLHDLVPVTDEAYRVKGSQIWLEPGERLTVDQMLKGIAIGSANDAAFALGEFIAGSPQGFVNQMNRTAARLGMTGTHFTNPHGLHSSQHYTTAHDLGILARHAVKYPMLLHYTSMWQDRSIRNGKGGTLWLISHNRLLRQFAGCDGLKTGYTSQAGFCIAATALRGNTRMIAIVLGAPSAKDRNATAANLMTWGFRNFRSLPIVSAGQPMAKVKVARGDRVAVSAIAARNLVVTVPIDAVPSIKVTRHVVQKVEAPLRKGQVLGWVRVLRGHQVQAQVSLVSDHAVRAVGFPELWWRYWGKVAG